MSYFCVGQDMLDIYCPIFRLTGNPIALKKKDLYGCPNNLRAMHIQINSWILHNINTRQASGRAPSQNKNMAATAENISRVNCVVLYSYDAWYLNSMASVRHWFSLRPVNVCIACEGVTCECHVCCITRACASVPVSVSWRAPSYNMHMFINAWASLRLGLHLCRVNTLGKPAPCYFSINRGRNLGP